MIDIINLKIGSYEQIIPEVYALKEIEEHNDWHNENVFDHTLMVLYKLNELTPCWPELHNIVNKNKRLDLLVLATTLHDIGKIKCIEGHEEISAEMAQSILPYFSLSENEHNIVTDLIKYHGEINKIFKKDTWKKNYDNLIKIVPKLEITLLGLADLNASRLPLTNSNKYNLIIDRYKEILGNKLYGILA